jgi:hypothetical protein
VTSARITSGFRSRCAIPSEWQWITASTKPKKTCLDEVIAAEVDVSLRDSSLIESERPFGRRAGGRTNISPADASSMTMKSKPLSSNVR